MASKEQSINPGYAGPVAAHNELEVYRVPNARVISDYQPILPPPSATVDPRIAAAILDATLKVHKEGAANPATPGFETVVAGVGHQSLLGYFNTIENAQLDTRIFNVDAPEADQSPVFEMDSSVTSLESSNATTGLAKTLAEESQFNAPASSRLNTRVLHTPSAVPRAPTPTEDEVRSASVGAVARSARPGQELAPTTGRAIRRVQKAERRDRKAFRLGAEKIRLAQTFGAKPGKKRPLFPHGSSRPNQNLVTRSGQELARSDRFGRQSDLGRPEQLDRLQGERAPRADRRAELKGRRKFIAADEHQRQLRETNEDVRDGVDTPMDKVRRVARRAPLLWRSRGK